MEKKTALCGEEEEEEEEEDSFVKKTCILIKRAPQTTLQATYYYHTKKVCWGGGGGGGGGQGGACTLGRGPLSFGKVGSGGLHHKNTDERCVLVGEAGRVMQLIAWWQLREMMM